MNLFESKLVTAGLFFLFIFLSGFWVKRTGRPHNVLILVVHKFIGLGMAVFLGLAVYRIHQITPLTISQITITVVTVLFFIVNVATGSLLSTNKPMPEVVSLINRFFPYLTVISTGAMLFLLA